MNFSSVINGVWWTLAEFLMNFGILCAHFGIVGSTKHWVRVPKCALTIEFLASNSLHNYEGQNQSCPMLQHKEFWNKFIEINFLAGCMVWPWWGLFQHQTISKNIDKMPKNDFSLSALCLFSSSTALGIKKIVSFSTNF